MKSVIALSFLLVLIAVNAETYTAEYDDFDVDSAVADTEKLKSLVDCFLDTAPCSAAGTHFKTDLPDVYQTACKKCNAKQKYILRKFLDGIKTKLPADYEAFVKKYDPEGKYSPAIDAAIA